ncbi:MAG TPA: hypothetical protein VKR06_46715, partial [Ktedonosporobacter sp.]|nr:hypothetical protein [Ktedonosporobacter sp.]
MRQDAELAWLNEQIDSIWLLVRDAHVREARTKSDQLISCLQAAIEEGGGQDRHLLKALADAYHVAGYTTSMRAKSHDALSAIPFYEEMRCIADTLENHALLTIAL